MYKMYGKIIKKGTENISIYDLMEKIKNNPKIGECGAIFSFEGIVRGTETDKKTVEMDLNTPNIAETERELNNIMIDIQNIHHGVIEIAVVHYVGTFNPSDPLFLAVVAGAHRKETREALNEVIERVKYELDFKKEEHTSDGINIIMSGG